MKPFRWKIAICLVPVVVAALVVALAVNNYLTGRSGFNFKLGVDLAGGTILVYEVDPDKKLPDSYKPEQLAAALKRRIDPADLYNVTIRPVSNTRVEIILPTGGAHQAEAEEKAWDVLVQQVKEKWPVPEGKALEVGQGRVAELVSRVKEFHPDATVADIEDFVNEHYKEIKKGRKLTGEEVQNIKELIGRQGSLEFRILANEVDDKEAIDKVREFFTEAQKKPEVKAKLDALAVSGKPPPPPEPPDGQAFTTNLGRFTYSWIELGPQERHTLHLDNAAEADTSPASGTREPRNSFWQRVAQARDKGEPVTNMSQTLLWSRKFVVPRPPTKDQDKKYEYFVLTRDPVKGNEVTGEFLRSAREGADKTGLKFAVHFSFNTEGGNRFYELTSQNAPDKSNGFRRHLAIVLDGQVVSAPTINDKIRSEGTIEGNFTKVEVDRLVNLLRSGALPATLKPVPVSENTMGATLGEDTIRAGTISVGLAFLAVLVFMLCYYRFAGLVACTALLANLLLTIAFMVVVNATFTLPGLAGLVLMLAMAVDANVLIYERLREERDRGASLALAIRNGYDRAFPTIIDTHLSSIFTAIVLYVVGNDQLKGFGISLTVGLVISLFTSLYMTRLLFDLWQSRGWLHKLSMLRLFSRPNIDFMGIRYYWFTATILLTIFGISVFLIRGKQGLNIDFNGGTAYQGELKSAVKIAELRDLVSEKSQAERLKVDGVKQSETDDHSYVITYADGKTRTVRLPDVIAVEEVKQRASVLPDLSVEQIFATGYSEEGGSRLFNVRTSEKARELVEASIDRLFGDRLKTVSWKYTLDQSDKDKQLARGATLTFEDPQTHEDAYASPSQVTMLLERELRSLGFGAQAQQFTLVGEEGTEKQGRYQKMRLSLREPLPAAKLQEALDQTRIEYMARPDPLRLENFDSQLAAETQTRALYAILASWGAILLYLWFRFGNWTFGLAAVICLIHDLLFTLGIIAFCHWMHGTFIGDLLLLQDFKIDLPTVAALLTLVGYSVNDTIVVFDRIREVRGKNPELTPQMINDSVNQTLSRTLLTSFITWLVVFVLYVWGGEGVHLFAFVMVVGVIVGTYSSIYIASPLLLIFGEGAPAYRPTTRDREEEARLGWWGWLTGIFGEARPPSAQTSSREALRCPKCNEVLSVRKHQSGVAKEADEETAMKAHFGQQEVRLRCPRCGALVDVTLGAGQKYD